jgi:hypothetical protein
MVKDEFVQIRVTPELKEKIRVKAQESGYSDMSKFIIDLIDGRMDGNKWNAAIKQELIKILSEDPTIVDKVLEQIRLEAVRK